MKTKLLATLVAIGCVVGPQVPAFAQGAAAYPQTLTPEDLQATAPNWDYVTPVPPRLYNQVSPQRMNPIENHHYRVGTEHTSDAR